MSTAEALCPHTLSIFSAPPSGVGYLHERQKDPAAERARVQAKSAAVDAVYLEENERLIACLRNALAALRTTEDGGVDVAEIIAECEQALSEIDPHGGPLEGGEGR